jgi:DUF4097 and DUF4098 domain-containing protein YvlB
MKAVQLVAAAVFFGLATPICVAGQTLARLDTTVRLNLRGTVDLALASGKITVRGWELPTVRVVATAETGTLRFDATPNRVRLRVERQAGKPRGDASYDVSVPRGTRLLLQSAAGNITASGSQGEVSATSVNGAINISGARRLVGLESVSGPIRASQLAGDLRAQNVSGSVRADNISGRIEGWTVNGDIRLTGGRSTDVRAETVGGDIIYTGPAATGGTYDFETHSGAIRITVPSNSGVQFRLATVSGAVQSDFRIPANAGGAARRPGRVDFTIGDGQAQVMARTFSGRIAIKSGGAPSIRTESASMVRSDQVPRLPKDSPSAIRKDSLLPIRKRLQVF